ncbi:MAG: hypothetical protein NWE99_06375 [Candidatus Bathyarchaeota archaeon]|nr:hypothetical protein [Candidatus Bathyarchaeota archaeon]
MPEENHLREVWLMVYDVDYVEGEKKGCSSRLTIENRIFYVKLFESPTAPPRYFAGDPNGVILKEISGNEFELWLRILAGKKADIEDIKRKISAGKKY